MAFTNQDLGACACGCKVTVLGCNSLPLPGATVRAYDHAGGTLLDSGTTDAAGTVTLASGGPAGYFEVASARFVTATVSASPCGQTVTLTPAAGYACIPTCAQPIATTLFVTYGGATFTLVYGGSAPGGCFGAGGWQTTAAVSVPGSLTCTNCANAFTCSCITGTVPAVMAATEDPVTGLAFTVAAWLGCACRGCAGVPILNPAVALLCAPKDATGVSVDCPPAFSASGTFPSTYLAGETAAICGSPGAFETPLPGGGGGFTATE